MNTIATKILTLGIMAALGGVGLVAGPSVGERLPSFGEEAAALPPTSVAVDGVADGAPVPELPAEEALALAGATAQTARELAESRRDAMAAVRESTRLARESLERPAPAEAPRGLDAQGREAMRGIALARREAVQSLNEAHRLAVQALAAAQREAARSEGEAAEGEAAEGEARRGRPAAPPGLARAERARAARAAR